MNCSKRKFIELLIKHGGFYSRVAKELKITPQAVSQRVLRNTHIKELVDSFEFENLDHAEYQLKRLIAAGDLGAICFYLKTKGKKRGYVERQEVTGADGKDFTIQVITSIPRPKSES